MPTKGSASTASTSSKMRIAALRSFLINQIKSSRNTGSNTASRSEGLLRTSRFAISFLVWPLRIDLYLFTNLLIFVVPPLSQPCLPHFPRAATPPAAAPRFSVNAAGKLFPSGSTIHRRRQSPRPAAHLASSRPRLLGRLLRGQGKSPDSP